MRVSFLSFSKSKEVAAFDIGSSSIKLVYMTQTRKGWELEKIGMVELPPEAIVDGSIIDSMTVTNALNELIKEHNVKVKDAVSSLTGHSVIIKKVSFPAMTEDELAESIQWEAEQYIPFPISEVNIDFQILGADVEGRGQMDVMLVAVKKDVINDYTNVIKEAGLNPVVVDVDSFALENMMEINYPVTPGETVAIVNIGASITSISVIVGGPYHIHEIHSHGGEPVYRRDPAPAQRELQGRGEYEARQRRWPASDATALTTAVESVSTNMTFEIKRSLDFFLGGAQGSYVNKIYMSGGTARR